MADEQQTLEESVQTELDSNRGEGESEPLFRLLSTDAEGQGVPA